MLDNENDTHQTLKNAEGMIKTRIQKREIEQTLLSFPAAGEIENEIKFLKHLLTYIQGMTLNPDNYTVEELLEHALMMLGVAQREQVLNYIHKKDWLVNNKTFDLIKVQRLKLAEEKN